MVHKPAVNTFLWPLVAIGLFVLSFVSPVNSETVCLKSLGCFAEQVGDKTLLVLSAGSEDPEWFVIDEKNVMRLRSAPPTLYRVISMDASQDGMYLALVSIGEGHPELLVLDLPALINGAGGTVKYSIDPYPGMVSVTGWKGNVLEIESDRLLSFRSKQEGRIPEELELYSPESFTLDMNTGLINPVNEELKRPAMYYIRHLFEKEDSRDLEKVSMALTALNDPETLPYLEKIREEQELSDSRKNQLDTLILLLKTYL